MIRSALIFCLLGLLTATGLAAENPLRIALVSENTAVRPGQPFYVGLHLKHPEGYHTYWKFAGIVGVPTAIKWRLPEGWSAEEIQWPAPERVMMFDYKAQGFHGEILLPMRLTPPANLQPGQSVTLEGQARWMCCGSSCFPGFEELKLTLPVSAAAPPADPAWQPRFAASLASAAQKSADWSALAERRGDQLTLRIRPLSERATRHLAQIQELTFFTEDGLVDANQPSSLHRSETGLVLTQTVSRFAPQPLPKSVVGILQTPAGWIPGGEPKSIRIEAALE